MPLYDYVCDKCDHRFETLVVGADKARCPKCGCPEVERVISSPGGYQINGINSASTRPSDSGSFRRKK